MKIKHLSKLLPLLSALTLLLSLTACGGGGGGGGDEDPVALVKTAKVTIGIQRIDHTQGSNVGSVDLDITLPSAFVLQTTANIPTTMTALVTGLNVQEGVNYTHPTLTLSLIKGDATAFSTGNLASFTRTLQSGETLPTASSFQLDLIDVSEISGNNVTIQTQNYETTLTIEEI